MRTLSSFSGRLITTPPSGTEYSLVKLSVEKDLTLASASARSSAVFIVYVTGTRSIMASETSFFVTGLSALIAVIASVTFALTFSSCVDVARPASFITFATCSAVRPLDVAASTMRCMSALLTVLIEPTAVLTIVLTCASVTPPSLASEIAFSMITFTCVSVS